MPDVFSKDKRSDIMSKVRGRGNEATEQVLARLFRAKKIKGWRRHADVFGKPDFVFPSARLAVFVDGCFWHGCPQHGTVPVTNHAFWSQKLDRNRARDRLVNRTLTRKGWRVIRIWQHELKDADGIVRRLRRCLDLALTTG